MRDDPVPSELTIGTGRLAGKKPPHLRASSHTWIEAIRLQQLPDTSLYQQARILVAGLGNLTAYPQEYVELRGILALIGDTQRQCNITVLSPDKESAYDEFLAG